MRTPLALLGSQTRQAAHSTKMCCALGTFGSHSVFATAAFIFPRQADRSSKSQNHGKSNPTANPLPLTTSLSTICTTPLLPPHAGEFMHREDVQHVGKHSMGALQHLGLPMKHKDMGGWGAGGLPTAPFDPSISQDSPWQLSVVLQSFSKGCIPTAGGSVHWSPHISPMLPLGVGSPQAPPPPMQPSSLPARSGAGGGSPAARSSTGAPTEPPSHTPTRWAKLYEGLPGLGSVQGKD